MSNVGWKSIAKGTLDLGNGPVECHVITNGTEFRRVLVTRQVQALLGGGAKDAHLGRGIERIAKASDGLAAGPSIEPTTFNMPTGGTANGYQGRDVVILCRALATGLKAGTLHHKQKPFAERAVDILGALAVTGIDALVDEASGYQSSRESRALQRIFAAAIRSEMDPNWQSRFPPSFYRAMAQLYCKPYDGGSPPRWMASVTDRIYGFVVGSEVRDEVKRRNPAPKHGQNHHQHLTEGFQRSLERDIEVVTMLARTSQTKGQFWNRMAVEFRGEALQAEFWTA